MPLKLYGVPLSQPWRSVCFALLNKRVPFKAVVTVPGIASKFGARSEEFLAKAPLGTVPVVEEEDGLVLWESPAILQYLAESRKWEDLYPSSAAGRAKINAFMHWHHTGTRELAYTLTPFFRPDMGVVTDELFASRRAGAAKTLETFGSVWLDGGNSSFIGGAPTASIADLLAYGEVAQMLPQYCNALPGITLPDGVAGWCERMQALPGHDATHASLAALGDVTVPNEVAMDKRMGAATKAGLQAIAKAQEV